MKGKKNKLKKIKFFNHHKIVGDLRGTNNSHRSRIIIGRGGKESKEGKKETLSRKKEEEASRLQSERAVKEIPSRQALCFVQGGRPEGEGLRNTRIRLQRTVRIENITLPTRRVMKT